jgi:FdhD protein
MCSKPVTGESREEIGPTTQWTVGRVTKAGSEPEEISVVREEPLSVEINDTQVAILMRLPGYEKELAAGFCLSEGLVASSDDIQIIQHCGSGVGMPVEPGKESTPDSRNVVVVRVPEGAWQRPASEVVRLIRSGCGSVGIEAGDLDLPVVDSQASTDADVILMLNSTMRDNQGLFRDVGAVHAAALFDLAGELVALYEDIGRHNAMDKALGHALLRGISLDDKMIATSGRASYEMVVKAIRLGIPIVASVSSPTSLAAQLAEVHGCTLIGYMRGRRFSIYTHPERVRLRPGTRA